MVQISRFEIVFILSLFWLELVGHFGSSQERPLQEGSSSVWALLVVTKKGPCKVVARAFGSFW